MSAATFPAPFTDEEWAVGETLSCTSDGSWIKPDGSKPTDREVAAAIWGRRDGVVESVDPMPGARIATWNLPASPVDSNDPRWAYPDLTLEQVYRSWPCGFVGEGGQCRTRLDEHADQAAQGAFPQLDITDHAFQPALDEGAEWTDIRRFPEKGRA